MTCSSGTEANLRHQLEDTQRQLALAERKTMTLVDHVAYLRSKEVSEDDVLRRQVKALEDTVRFLRATLAEAGHLRVVQGRSLPVPLSA